MPKIHQILLPLLVLTGIGCTTAVEKCHMVRDKRGWDAAEFEAGCAEGDFECCGWAADAVMGLDRTLEGEPDAARAAALAQKACELAKAKQHEDAVMQCSSAAFYLCAAERTDCERRCEAGDAVACHDLSRWHRFGFRHGSPGLSDPERELVYLRKACERKHSEACLEVALVDCKTDDAQCLAACEEGDAVRCFALGRLYRTGDGVPENRLKAERLEAKACELDPKVDRRCGN